MKEAAEVVVAAETEATIVVVTVGAEETTTVVNYLPYYELVHVFLRSKL